MTHDNEAIVRHAYHTAEGDVLDVAGFVGSFAEDGVFNDVVGQESYRGDQLGEVVLRMGKLLPDVHRELHRVSVLGDVVAVELSIQGTFLGPLETPAGIVRASSTPAYFFGSKEALYDTILARVVARGQEAMARAYAKGGEAPSAEDAVESYVGAALDFLGHDQNFIHLIQREALGDGSRLAEFFRRSVDEAVVALGPAADKAGISRERLILDLTALCWYPFAHEHTLLPALGMKARDPAFLNEQKRHISDLVRAMTRASRERGSRRQRSDSHS